MRLKGESLGATAQLSKPEIVSLVNLIDKHLPEYWGHNDVFLKIP